VAGQYRQALGPEVVFAHVEPESTGQRRRVGHADRREQIVVAGTEAVGIVEVFCVQTDAEQQTEGVRPVVKTA